MTYLAKSYQTLHQERATLFGAFQSFSKPGQEKPLHLGKARNQSALWSEIEIDLDPEVATYWCFMKPQGRPSFSVKMLSDIIGMQHSIKEEYGQRARDGVTQIKYFVLGSKHPGVFSLGGDLPLFVEKIRAQDRTALRNYARLCVEAVYNNAVSFHLPIVTIALVQGDALGGGFEAALACNMIVAERSAKFGLPEVLFNLFPGMGAYSFLSRRLDGVRAERIIFSGRTYSAEELYEMGLVDLVAEDGQGEQAVRELIERQRRRHNAYEAVFQARRRVQPITHEELLDITEIWVDAALRLEEADLKRMLRLAAAQERRKPASQTPQLVAAE